MEANFRAENQGWKGYYMYNDEALALIRTWREASPKHKGKVLAELLRRLSYMVQARIKYYKPQPFYSDLLQEGKLGLIKAIEDFDPLRGINFFKFASWHIRSRINNYLRWWKRTLKEMEGDSSSEFYVEVPTPQDHFERIEKRQVLLRAIDRLPELDRKVVMMRYGVGCRNYTLKQIGDAFSLSKQRIQQIEFRAIAKLGKNQDIKNLF